MYSMGSRDGTVVRALASYHCGLGLIPRPGVTCGLSLLLVLLLTLKVFSRFSTCTCSFPFPYRAGNNGRSTDNVRPEWRFVQIKSSIDGHPITYFNKSKINWISLYFWGKIITLPQINAHPTVDMVDYYKCWMDYAVTHAIRLVGLLLQVCILLSVKCWTR